MPDLIIHHNGARENPNYELNMGFTAAIKEFDISRLLIRCDIRKDSHKLKGVNQTVNCNSKSDKSSIDNL